MLKRHDYKTVSDAVPSGTRGTPTRDDIPVQRRFESRVARGTLALQNGLPVGGRELEIPRPITCAHRSGGRLLDVGAHRERLESVIRDHGHVRASEKGKSLAITKPSFMIRADEDAVSHFCTD